MKNVSIDREGDILTLKIDLSKSYGPSQSSGKTDIIASTQGNIRIPGLEDYGFRLGLTLYNYPGVKQYIPEIPNARVIKKRLRKNHGKKKEG